MWQELIVFVLAAGSIWFLGRQFWGASRSRKDCCGCAGCSSRAPFSDITPAKSDPK